MSDHKLLRKAVLCLGLLAPAVPGRAQTVLFSDDFNLPDGSAFDSSKWQVTSGAMRISGGAAWSNSSVFRVVSRRTDFKDVEVSFRLLNQGLTSGSGAGWHGVHTFLRYQSEFHIYYVTINRRDNTAIIKKKVPGGPSNGGTYYDLTGFVPYPVPQGRWQQVRATARNNPDGSVTVALYMDGRLVAQATDRGVGGPPITRGGKVGVRGDFTNLKFDDFTARSLSGTGGGTDPGPGPAPGPGASSSSAQAPEKFLSPALADGVNDAAVFGPDADEVWILDARGQQVFRRTRSSGRIVWDGKDDSGRVVDSGVYVARIRRPDGAVEYQSFAVVK